MNAAGLRRHFVSESLEHMDAFEAALMEMRSGASDPELVHGAFRAVHSVKGACGAFGLTHLLEFSHDVESELDRVRAGERAVTPEFVFTMLDAVDCLRTLLSEAEEGRDTDVAECEQVRAQLRELDGAPKSGAQVLHSPQPTGRWRVLITPAPDALLTMDPLSVLAGLQELGDVTGSCQCDDMPALAELDPEACHIGWELTITGAREDELQGLLSWFDEAGQVLLEPLAPATPATAEPAAPAAKALGSGRKPRGSSIRVDVDKVDGLMNLLGELVIDQTMLASLARDYTASKALALQAAIERLEADTRALQEAVMGIRMLPASVMLQRVPRTVDDLCRALGKEVDLIIEGERTEIDKRVLEELADPLMHMLRNAIDHGLESPTERVAAGKPRRGRLHISTYHRGGYVCVEIHDDGAGLDEDRILASARRRGIIPADATADSHDACQLIFAPGLSTAESVTDVSGRGVGMDVVRRNIESLGGTISASSRPGLGCSFTIRLPLTLAIVDGQLIRVAQETYVIPMLSIIESIRCPHSAIQTLPGDRRVVQFRDGDVPVAQLAELLGGTSSEKTDKWALMIVVDGDRGPVAFMIDELLSQQQVVVKSLDHNYGSVPGISAATILGDGEVALIVDVHAVSQMARHRAHRGQAGVHRSPPRHQECNDVESADNGS